MSKTTKSSFLFFLLFFFSLSHLYAFQNNTSLPLYEEGNIYLKVKDDSAIELGLPGNSNNPQDIESIFVQYGVTEILKPFEDFRTSQFDRIYKVTVQQIEEVGDLISDLSKLSYIQFAERVPYKFTNQIQPNDPSVPTDSYQLGLINAYDAFEVHQGGALIAIVDNAIRVTHEDLAGNFIIGRDVAEGDDDPNPTNTEHTHGTRVAGIACGVTNNSIGVASIGWNNNLMAVKATLDNEGANVITHGYEGIMWAANNNAEIISTSWGAYGYSEAEYMCVVQARDMGAIIVNSAGNANTAQPNYPAAYGESTTNEPWEVYDKHLVLAVASIDENGEKSDFSNSGKWVDISAYGSDIFTTDGTGDSDYIGGQNGTSYSAPLVSGLLGLMKSAQPNATNEELINCLLSSSNQDIYDIPIIFNTLGALGSGRVDALNALLCIQPNCTSPLAYIFSSNSEVCPNETVELIATEGTGYTWSTGETSQSISINQSGTYTVTVTIDGMCTASKSITILECPEASCFCDRPISFNFGIDDGDIHNFSELPGIPPFFQYARYACVTFKGKVRFDLPQFSFFNCDIYLSPGAELIVPDGSFLGISNCNIQGCSEMWRGIVAESGSDLRLAGNLISDAQYAVTAYTNSNLTIFENIFDRNFVGIYVPPTLGTFFSPGVINQTIPTGLGNTVITPWGSVAFPPDKGNKFVCTSNLSMPYNGQTPSPGDITFSGMMLYHVNFFEVGFPENVFWPNYQLTTFDGLRNGIIAYQTVLDIENTTFKNMIGDDEGSFPFYPSAPLDNSGMGILSYNSNGLELKDCNFENSFIGMNSRVSDINGITGCEFHNVGTGIKINNSDEGYNILIGGYTPSPLLQRNSFYCREGGIIIHDASRSNMQIQNNWIYREPNSTEPFVGIGVYNTILDVVGSGNVIDDGGVGDIYDNDIFLTNESLTTTDIGIEVLNSEQIKINANVINDMDSPGDKILVSLEGSKSIQFRNNGLFRDLVNPLSTALGLKVVNCVNTVYCCNNFLFLDEAINFSGFCKDTKLRGNFLLKYETRGLFLSTGTVLGDQGSPDDPNLDDFDEFLPGNLWSNLNSNALGAELEFEPDKEFNRFFFDPLVANSVPNIVSPSGDWFIPNMNIQNQTTIDCQTQLDCEVPVVNITGNDPTFDAIDSKIAEENLNDIYDGGITWEGKRYLFNKLNSNVSTEGNTILDNFFNFNTNNTLGELYSVDEDINDLYNFDNSYVDVVLDKKLAVRNTLNLINEKNDLLLTAPIEDHPLILSEKQNLIQQLSSQNEELNIAKNDYHISKQPIVGTISNQNSNIVTTEVYEQNRKSVNDIYLNTFASGIYSLNKSQEDIIKSIAYQCPLSGGNAVFEARGMLKFVIGNINFDDASLCGNVEEREDKNEQVNFTQNSNSLNIFPNPTNGKITLKLDYPVFKDLTIELFDLSGKLITTLVIPSNEFQINIDMSKLGINSGTYLYKCRADDEIFNGKIVFIK